MSGRIVLIFLLLSSIPAYADTLAPLINSTSMHSAFKDQGVPSELLIIEGGGHGFRDPQHRLRAQKARLDWFDRHLRK